MDNVLKKYLVEQLLSHEGVELKTYKCSAGRLTIGVGRNLSDRGVSYDEALILLKNDIDFYFGEVSEKLDFFNSLSMKRKAVLVNMAFNLGVAGLMGFKNMLAAIAAGDYEQAAEEMLNSLWAKQVGNRAIELSKTMLAG
ncbi:glycoside hydrolase family protein [Microbulbifer sp. ZKSA006]|uniref:glycoside hydrolase family protein n=1 Tax=Microbulbifer sp. ZKSA006 TaxID=3243390 RepID=UPI0040395118